MSDTLKAQAWLRDSERRHHAYLLSGHNSVELRAVALDVAQLFLCHEDKACAQRLASNSHPDFMSLEPDANIDAIRALIARVHFKPREALCKVIVLNDADGLQAGAQNALLKTLEEPPPNTHFILTTARLKGLKLTIRSRCQIVRLSSASSNIEIPDDLRASLKEFDPLRLAAELGSDKERADLAILAIEQQVVEGLQQSGPQTARLLRQTAQALTALRLEGPKQFNRTLALENLLLSLRRALCSENP
jgi:hypothetical protein